MTKFQKIKAMVFPVIMWKCERWTIKKAEYWRIAIFELWCWRRLLSSLDCKEIKPNNPEYSLERLILKLKLQHFGYLMWRTDSWGKTLMLQKIEGKRRRGWQRMRWLDGIIDSKDMSWSKLCSLWCSQRVGHNLVTGQQQINVKWGLKDRALIQYD